MHYICVLDGLLHTVAPYLELFLGQAFECQLLVD
jgi:hypothetical protein